MTHIAINCFNASVRIAGIVSTVKAGTLLLELASKALNVVLSRINKSENPNSTQMEPTVQQGEPGYARQVYDYAYAKVPSSMKVQNKAFKALPAKDLVAGIVCYTTVAVFATFVANKIAPMPQLYTTLAKYANYDVIQLTFNYFTKK